MPTDLSYFFEENMNSDKFLRRLPSHLSKMFKESFDNYDGASVMQEHKGPIDLHCGLKEVSYWYGISKHYNWAPIAGQFFFAIGRIMMDTKWHSLYFDSLTGECLGYDKSDATEKLNSKGMQLLEEKDFKMAIQYFENTIKCCSVTNNDASKFRKNLNLAQAEMKKDGIGDRSNTKQINEALSVNNSSNIRIEADYILANSYFDQSKKLWNEAWIAEKHENIDEANAKFKVSHEFAGKALQIVSNKRNKMWKIICSLKIEGNELFNEAIQLQVLANELKEKQNYCEALNEYRKAQDKYQQGFNVSQDERFEECAAFVKECIAIVENLLKNEEFAKGEKDDYVSKDNYDFFFSQ